MVCHAALDRRFGRGICFSKAPSEEANALRANLARDVVPPTVSTHDRFHIFPLIFSARRSFPQRDFCRKPGRGS